MCFKKVVISISRARNTFAMLSWVTQCNDGFLDESWWQQMHWRALAEGLWTFTGAIKTEFSHQTVTLVLLTDFFHFILSHHCNGFRKILFYDSTTHKYTSIVDMIFSCMHFHLLSNIAFVTPENAMRINYSYLMLEQTLRSSTRGSKRLVDVIIVENGLTGKVRPIIGGLELSLVCCQSKIERYTLPILFADQTIGKSFVCCSLIMSIIFGHNCPKQWFPIRKQSFHWMVMELGIS